MGRPNDKTGNEEHVRGRRAGVSDTYGRSRKGVAERTVFPAHDSNDGGGEDGLKTAASSIYRKAVENRGDDQGDKALTER
jgi:hypothetical protein